MTTATITVQFKGQEAHIPNQDGLHEIPSGDFRLLPTYVLVRGDQALCMTSKPKTTDWTALDGDDLAKDIEDGVIFWA